MQPRLRSKVLWTAVSALVLFFLKNRHMLPALGMTEDSYNQLVDLLLTFLIAVGIINNPKDPRSM